MHSEAWNEYVTHALHQTQELDRQPLGGQKPEYANAGGPVNAADEEGSFKPKIPAMDIKSKEEGGEDEKEMYSSGDTYNDQVIFSNFFLTHSVCPLLMPTTS